MIVRQLLVISSTVENGYIEISRDFKDNVVEPILKVAY